MDLACLLAVPRYSADFLLQGCEGTVMMQWLRLLLL
jgi:hypothetical protein